MSNIISFSKINKRGGVGIRAGGGWKIFQKLISGGDDYSVLESTLFLLIQWLGRNQLLIFRPPIGILRNLKLET